MDGAAARGVTPGDSPAAVTRSASELGANLLRELAGLDVAELARLVGVVQRVQAVVLRETHPRPPPVAVLAALVGRDEPAPVVRHLVVLLARHQHLLEL